MRASEAAGVGKSKRLLTSAEKRRNIKKTALETVLNNRFQFSK